MFIHVIEVFLVFLRLGLTSFGGPIAHLGYFHEEFVKRKKWVDEHTYVDLVALCQFLPGPASSQVGIAVGLHRAGYLGAIAAWVGFTLPSAIILVFFGLGISRFQIGENWLHGLKIVAVAVVAQAIWSMAIKLCPDKQRVTIAVLSAALVAAIPSAPIQFFVLFLGGLFGLALLRTPQELPRLAKKSNVSKAVGFVLLFTFILLLIALPLVAKTTNDQSFKLFDSFFRAGSLVFGGGHVVLPMLQSEVVPQGWVSKDIFMAGYGAAQAVPGPLFTFTAFLGAVSKIPPSGVWGALICLIAAFLPSFLLVIGVMPFWTQWRTHQNIRFAMNGVNAAVVGLLLAAFFNPVWTSAIFTPKDFALASVCFLLLAFWKTPPWVVVILSAAVGGIGLLA